MYLLINRENIVVDILAEIRYIKLQSNPSIVIACSEGEATGVIGSDCNSHFILANSDMTGSIDAVRILSFDGNIPEDYEPNFYKYDNEKNELTYYYSLEEYQKMKQEENKKAFANFLINNPLTWIDGKQYGVTEEDQSEISLNMNQYSMAVQAGAENPRLEWHARQEECTSWTVENLTALALAISDFVYPYYKKMQQYKTQIYTAKNYKEIKAIELKYEN
jgi:hypothetical protein